MRIITITFSPTGGTKKCAERLAQSIGETVQKIDLTERNLTDTAVADEAEFVIIAVPSYGGRMPSLAAERLKKIDGRGKPTTLLIVYGNRAFEDTLVELEDVAKAQNFLPTAAVAAIAQHCMDGSIATNRPDAADLAKLCDFGQKIADKLSVEASVLSLPGNRPYKKAGAGMQPKTAKGCTHRHCLSHCGTIP